MKSIWTANYENQDIEIENNWFSGEKLFVNKELQDYKQNLYTSELTGHLINNKGEKLIIKARILQKFFGIGCVLFIDDKQIPLKQIK